MKHTLYIIGMSAAALFCTSCEDFKFGSAFLDKPITTDITIDSIFAHRKYAEQVLTEAYHSMPDFLASDGRYKWHMVENLTDLGDCYGGNDMYSGQATASEPGAFPYSLTDMNDSGKDGVKVKVSGPLSGIRQAYIYLENVDKVPDMTDEEKWLRRAEAKMIIAYHYSDMLRYYGGMPWIDHSYTTNDDMNFTRMTVEEHVNKIVELCSEAALSLPWSVSTDDEGRMCAAGALALKSRVLTFAASPLFNSDKPFMEGAASDALHTWYGNYDETRWQRALNAGLEFLEMNQANGDYYQLYETGKPRADYFSGYYDRCNKEALIVSHRYNKIDNWWRRVLCMVRWGRTIPSAVYGDMFETVKGETFDWNNPEHAQYPFFDATGKPTRDPRLYETLWVNGDSYRGRKTEIYAGGQETWEGTSATMEKSTYNGYGLRKFCLDQDKELFAHYYQCPLLRLPEIYLNIAEAMNQLDIANQKDKFGRDAYDYINLVRNRVNMPDLDKEKYPQGEALLNAILHERAVEFGFEEVRYFDINRHKRKDLLEAHRFRLKTYKNADNTFRYERTDDVNQPTRGWVERWSNRYYLIPIAVDEINKKYGLIQNPGWE